MIPLAMGESKMIAAMAAVLSVPAALWPATAIEIGGRDHERPGPTATMGAGMPPLLRPYRA